MLFFVRSVPGTITVKFVSEKEDKNYITREFEIHREHNDGKVPG